MKKYIISLVVLFTFISCTHEKKTNFENASFQMKSYGKIYAKYNQPYDIKVDMSYPEVNGASSPKVVKELNDAVIRHILSSVGEDTVFATMDELFNNLTKSYDEMLTDDPINSMPWELERKVEVNYNAKGIFGIKYEEYGSLGGVHPNTIILFSNFDLATGRQLSYSDLFVDGFDEKLNAIAEKIFREQKNLTPDQKLEEADFWFENNKFALNNNFYLTTEGIRFYYNTYEITAYVYGPTDLLIQFEKIKDILKRKDLIAASGSKEE
ncbi:MAG: DUF3298 domain-containing protein [bacterium]